MNRFRWQEALALCIVAALWVTACGGGGGGGGTTTTPPSKQTPTVTVAPGSQSVTTVQSLSVTVGVSGSSSTPTGSVVLSSGTYPSSSPTVRGGGAARTLPR